MLAVLIFLPMQGHPAVFLGCRYAESRSERLVDMIDILSSRYESCVVDFSLFRTGSALRNARESVAFHSSIRPFGRVQAHLFMCESELIS